MYHQFYDSVPECPPQAKNLTIIAHSTISPRSDLVTKAIVFHEFYDSVNTGKLPDFDDL